jgi:peptide-methionine (S)-S-oxide reductase
MGMKKEIATLAGGCFWCLEAVFDELKGVESVESGYMGGKTPRPTYESVCGGATGHAEVVQVTFDPAVLAYRDLLSVFFTIHDPTTLNRQGNDMGTQYRSAIFYHSEEQKRAAEEVMASLAKAGVFRDQIVTEITPAAQFHVAEEYHQEYYARVGGGNPYCSYVIEPKVAKFRKSFVERLKR